MVFFSDFEHLTFSLGPAPVRLDPASGSTNQAAVRGPCS